MPANNPLGYLQPSPSRSALAQALLKRSGPARSGSPVESAAIAARPIVGALLARREEQAQQGQLQQQRQALAKALQANPQGQQLAGLLQSAGPETIQGVRQAMLTQALSPDQGDPFTLSPGQARFEGRQKIAEVPAEQKVTAQQFREGDKFVTRRVVNGQPDMSPQGILAQSPIDRVQRIEQGEPGAFENIGETEARFLRDQQTATMNVIDTGSDIITLLSQAPDVNTFAAGGARFVNNIQQEGIALARVLGKEFDPNVIDPSTYSETFDELGVQNAQMRSLFTALAFQAAAAAGQEGRAISDADIKRFLQQSGANERDPKAIAQVVTDLVKRTEKAFENSYKVRTEKDFEGDLGTIPSFESLVPLKAEDLEGFDKLSPEDKAALKALTPQQLRQLIDGR